jgi:hypothetical protein
MLGAQRVYGAFYGREGYVFTFGVGADQQQLKGN